METGSERGQAAWGFRGRPSHCQALPFLQEPLPPDGLLQVPLPSPQRWPGGTESRPGPLSLLENSRGTDSSLSCWVRGRKGACPHFSKRPEAPAWGWGLPPGFRRPLCRDGGPCVEPVPRGVLPPLSLGPHPPGLGLPRTARGALGASPAPRGRPAPACPGAGAAPCGGPPCPQQCSCAKELVPSQHAVLNLTNLPTKLNRGGRS